MAYIPLSPNSYQGKQVLINSDRLIFNAKDVSILLFSKQDIGFSTNGSFHFDTSPNNDSSFIINSPNIYLGLEYDNTLPTQPAVLGDELQDILRRIINQIMGLMNDIEFKITYMVSVPGAPTGPNPANTAALQGRYQNLQDIMRELDGILSSNTKLV